MLSMQVEGVAGWSIVDGNQTASAPFVQRANDFRGLRAAPNVRFTATGYMECLLNVPAANLQVSSLAQLAKSELLVDYGPSFWAIQQDLGSAGNPIVTNVSIVARVFGNLGLSGPSTAAPGDSLDEAIALDDEPPTTPRQLPDAAAFVRTGLYVARSGAGMGLFSSVAVPAGSLLGYFGGTWQTASAYAELPMARQEVLNRYSVDVQPQLEGRQPEDMVVAPPIASGEQRPNLSRYPLAAMNEPSLGNRANAAFQRVQLSVDDVRGRVLDQERDGEWVGLAVYACSAIAQGEEIKAHYGPGYPRGHYGYAAGEPCEIPYDAESPLALGRVPISEVGIIPASLSDVSDSSDDSYAAPKRRKSTSGGASSSAPPPPAPPSEIPPLAPEILRAHEEAHQREQRRTGASTVEQVFAKMALTATKRPLEVPSTLQRLRAALVETDVEEAMQLLNESMVEIDGLYGSEQAAAEELVASAHEAAATMLEDQAADGERVCIWDCESTELVKTGTSIPDMEISVVSCLLLNLNAALSNPAAELERAMNEDLYSFWRAESGRGAPLTLLGSLLGHAKHNVAYNSNFDLLIARKHLSPDAYAHARRRCLDPFQRLRATYGTPHKLSHLLESNGLPEKSGTGSEAPTLWRQRRFNELLKYNVGDVELLARLVLLKALRLPDGRQTVIGTLASMLPTTPAKFHASDSRSLAQGSPDWFAARKNKITASLAPALLGFGFLTREDSFEVLMGTGETEKETPAMRRGQALEPVAAEAYARQTGQTVATTGLWVDSSRPWLAASPDRLVGSHGLLEVKSPAKISEASVAMAIQVQIQLLVTGRSWCDLMQYTIEGTQRVDRILPDPSLVKLLLSHLKPIADAALEAVATGSEEDTFPPEMSIEEKRELRDEIKESLQSHRRRLL